MLLEEQLYRLENPKFKLETFLFDKQLSFVNDPEPFKTAVCSRRSGKTVSCAADLIHSAIHYKETVQLYVTLSRNNAKKIIWPELLKINQTFKLGAKPDNTELSLRFPNGSIIYLSGANDKSEIEKFRGLPLKKAYIDECQSFRSHIGSLIDDVLSPALMDYAGSLCLIGTPGPIPVGYFHDCAVSSDSWSHHQWTFWDNPFIASKSGLSHQMLLDRELKRRGVSTNDPTIQREWFGKWILDSESLLIQYDQTKNNYDKLPIAKWNYIMGIDLGFNDADAIALLAWSESQSVTYLVEEVVAPKQGLTELVSQIERMRGNYDINKLMIDEGGLGKKIAEELRRRFQIPVQAADKARKMENVALLNDALRTSRFKAKKDSRFAQDSFLLEIDRDKTTPDKIKVKDSFHSDIIDAVLYAFKESYAFTHQPKVPKPKFGTEEWAQKEATDMERAAEEYFKEQAELTKGYDEWEI